MKNKELKKIHTELLKSLQSYQKSISFMAGDAPIGVLCLPKSIETVLVRNDCLRIYDLFNRDLTKIKGIGKTRIRYLTSSLNEFISIS